MSYSRFFMPLAEESKGYDFKGRTPTGRCIVEERGNMGKLSLLVQDLKPQTKYGIYLIFTENRNHVGLCMGPLDVDTKGKAEIRRDITDLHNFALKEIVAVAVIATDSGATGVVSPLCGYKDNVVAWRHGFEVYTEKTEEPPPEEPQIEELQAEEPPAEEPQIEEPQIEEPPAEEPPVAMPPMPTPMLARKPAIPPGVSPE